jgi:tetratricopeptide (TPR) repeat protein
MRLADLYERAINWPSPTGIAVTLAVATLSVLAGFSLSFGKRPWFGRALGFIGLCVLMVIMLAVLEQTNTEKLGVTITLKRYRYTERTRMPVYAAMLVLPCVAVAVMWSSFLKARYERRSQVPRLLKAGRKHFVQKDFDSALREYNQAVDAAPELAEPYCRRGLVYHEMGKTAQALTDLDRAIQCDPRMPSAYLERGKIRTESGDLDGALADFGHLMLIRANDPNTYLQRGVCLVKKGLINDAMADFHRVLKLTNHSDFAEPAKNYLREVLENQPGPPPQLRSNGAAGVPSSPQPRVQDHAI